ncbi:glycosyltransferase [Flavobacterium sp. SUN046]|uniref:glycosyltransferase n=1 Tax=Flavobacterium sp. SUN046 TaxID=3002440 RepID=UPI002DB7ED29|nr:glycosyltransferase [Flavobacterium sp. SUN046]MEC4050881.1 glycosyltransferase [Flavobacterium sp. SUN046]
MKKILFFVESFQCGGAERSLLSLLNNLDYSGYEVRIMVVKKGGEFEKFVPSHLKVEKVDFTLGLLSRMKYKIARFLDSSKKYHKAQLFWKSIKSDVPYVEDKFDIAISWGQGFATYFVAERVNADKKFAWVNIDYKKAGYDWQTDLSIYEKFNTIVGVSVFVKEAMQEFIAPEKVISIRNIIDAVDIIQRAQEPISLTFDKDVLNIVSVGRLAKQKGFELAVKAAEQLKDNGLAFKWYIIGEGPERAFLESLINECQLQNHVVLLGLIDNPYPYIKQCDIYVQSSWFEGLGRTIIEAGILCKPIVTTDFPTAYAILDHEKTGLIIPMTSEAIASSIQMLISDSDLKNRLVKNLEMQSDTEKQKTLDDVKRLFDN